MLFDPALFCLTEGKATSYKLALYHWQADEPRAFLLDNFWAILSFSPPVQVFHFQFLVLPTQVPFPKFVDQRTLNSGI